MTKSQTSYQTHQPYSYNYPPSSPPSNQLASDPAAEYYNHSAAAAPPVNGQAYSTSTTAYGHGGGGGLNESDGSMPIQLPPDTLAQSNADGHHNHHHHQHHTHIMQESEEELTEDEQIEYEKGLLTWEKAKQWRFWFRKEWAWYYAAFVLLIVVVALMAFFHHQIVNWLTPFTRKLEALTAGYVIPVAILFVLSFPPLFGNEIVMILVGIVWGLGKGFAIVAIGMSLGEIANFFVFKYWCSARAERMTRKSLNYACLTQVVKDGGFWMAFMIRLSAIPTHFSTVLFAVCGLKFWQYCLALIAGLPKQLIAVYVGVVLAGSEGDTSRNTSSTVISDCVFAATAIITLGSLWFIHRKMVQVRKKVLIGMRKDLVGKGVMGVGEVPGDSVSSGSEEGMGRGRGGPVQPGQHRM